MITFVLLGLIGYLLLLLLHRLPLARETAAEEVLQGGGQVVLRSSGSVSVVGRPSISLAGASEPQRRRGWASVLPRDACGGPPPIPWAGWGPRMPRRGSEPPSGNENLGVRRSSDDTARGEPDEPR